MYTFTEYITEVIGADSMERDPVDLIQSPDIKRASQMMFFSGTSGTIPTFWNNSPFLAGGRMTSTFGANPEQKKGNVLSYEEFIKTTSRFQNK